MAARAAAEPDWRPVLESNAAEWPPPNQPAELLRWLADREAAFPDWVACYAPDGTWDFSADSLRRLDALLRTHLDDEDTVDDPAHAELVDGACWYLGETYHRGGNGVWEWDEEASRPPGPIVTRVGPKFARIYLRHTVRDGMLVSGYLGAKYLSLVD